MEKNLPIEFGEILFGSRISAISKQLSRMERGGRIRKIAPRIYTSNFKDPAEEIIRRNLLLILGKLFPGALLSHRSAFELEPTPAGHIFLTYTYTKKVRLPGVVLRFIQGPEPAEGDKPVSGHLYVSQKERALLENLQTTRQEGDASKNLPRSALQSMLDEVLLAKGPAGVDALLGNASEIAQSLGFIREFKELSKLAHRVKSTKPSKIGVSRAAASENLGEPYDTVVLGLLERLLAGLRNREFPAFPDAHTDAEFFRNLAFFEAWFACKAEGSTLELSEAWDIIETGDNSMAYEAGHFIRVWNLQNSAADFQTMPTGIDLPHLLDLEEKLTGAGKFENTAPPYAMIRGTLSKAFEYSRALEHPFARGVFAFVTISLVRPFTSGNRIAAALLLTAELVKANQSRIVFPPRLELLLQKELAGAIARRNFNSLIDLFVRIWRFSDRLKGKDFEALQHHLTYKPIEI